ncbi:hypothetical protein IFR04_006192 [Cadophora malorum]|uniref:C2H2-type domain-containing protein n=1 Tax=Cadophora malorum TaxID=108018 RepID=A0A8H7WBE7_9HELO|nr:hypothetical protein IFR04_006192 [Cadophora malorum]
MKTSFPCPQCQTVFSRSAHLRRHQKTHLSDKPYACQFCTVASSRKDVILRHTRNFHPELVEGGHDDNQPEELPAGSRSSRSPQGNSNFNPFSPMSDSGITLGTPQMSDDERSQDQDQNEDRNQLCEETRAQDQGQGHDQVHYDDTYFQEPPLQTRVLAQSGHTQNKDQQPGFWDQPIVDQALLEYAMDFDFELFNFQTDEILPKILGPLPALPLNTQTNILNPVTKQVHAAALSNAEELPACSSSSSSSSSSQSNSSSSACFSPSSSTSSPRDADYESALANFKLIHKDHINSTFSFPPKDTTHRFVDAFFTHTAPHLPLIHRPSFNIATVASPLLLEVMAFGALYLCKRTTAVALHCTTQQLMFQNERGDEALEQTSEFQLWTLQTYLLMSYFGAYGGTSAMQQRVTHVFPYAIKVITGSYRLQLGADVINKTDRAVRILDLLLKERMVAKDSNCSTPDPLLYSTRALLNSLYYHLYASEILTEMKRLLKFPRKRKAPGQNPIEAKTDHWSHMNIALIRAADAMKSDCHMGINYLQRVAPHQLGPVCAIACYEGGLLLSWYLSNKVSLLSRVESSAALDRVIDIVSSEMDETRSTDPGRHSSLPLEVAAVLLSDRSVWQFPSGISEKLKQLTRSSANEPSLLVSSM